MFRRLTISMSKSCVCTNNVYLKFFLQKSSFTVYVQYYVYAFLSHTVAGAFEAGTFFIEKKLNLIYLLSSAMNAFTVALLKNRLYT